MSPGLLKMWISFFAMFLMIIAAALILLSRTKLKGFFKYITAFIAYILFFISGLIMVFIVMSSPV